MPKKYTFHIAHDEQTIFKQFQKAESMGCPIFSQTHIPPWNFLLWGQPMWILRSSNPQSPKVTYRIYRPIVQCPTPRQKSRIHMNSPLFTYVFVGFVFSLSWGASMYQIFRQVHWTPWTSISCNMDLALSSMVLAHSCAAVVVKLKISEDSLGNGSNMIKPRQQNWRLT